MKLTNKFNLPQTFVNVLERPTYSKGKAHLSATELLMPPQIAQLRKTYWEDLEEDVADRIWAIFGTAIHSILELGKDDNHIIEQRLHAEVDGWNISGAIDLQRVEEDGIIVSDYKTTGAWAVMNEKIEWEQQLNIYAWLVESIKKTPVKKIEIIAIIRDWSRRDAQNKEGYPEAPVKVIDVPLWTYEARESFIKERVGLHSNAYLATETGEDYVLCTPVEMWEKQTSYAVKKIGNKRATNVFTDEADAQAKMDELGKGYEVEVREGERTRCDTFCPVNKFCKQYQDYLKEKV